MTPTKTLLRKTLLLTVICFSFSTLVFGQKNNASESPEPPLFKGQNYCWGSAGLGLSTFGLVANSHLAFQKNKHLFTANLNYNFETTFSSEYSPTHLLELSVLYGRTFSNSWVKASASAGIGSIKYDEFIDEYFNAEGQKYAEREVNSAVGVPLQAELFFPLYENMGFGFTAFANLNGIQSFTGFTLSVFVGKFP